MSLVNLNFSFMFSLFCITFVLPFINTAPTETRDDPFDTFIDFLSKNNCSMPKEVELPFPATNLTPFDYLSAPLEECKSPEALKENSKAFWLCKEVFIVLENITCNEYNLPLSKINSSHLSVDVCKDFAAIQNILPEHDEYLSRRLSGDNVICKLLCSEKYELLCKTLLWSYDTQAKIKNALDSKVKENGKESVSSVVPDKETSIAVQAETSVKNQETSVKNLETSVKNSEEINEIPDKMIPNLEDTKNVPNVSTLNQLDSVSKNPVPDPIVINENNSPISSNKDGKLIKPNSTTQETKTLSIQPDTQRVSQKNVQDEGVQTAKLPGVSDKNTDHEENSIEQQSENTKIETPLIEINPDINSLTPENKINENGELNKSVQRLPGKENNEGNTSSDTNIKPDEKLENSAISPTEVQNNDLNSIDFQDQENETKGKGKQPDLNKKVENSKESSISDGATSETDSKLLESTALPIIPDKNEDFEPHQEVKDSDQYNDSENEGDYAKPEYDNGFSPSLKKEIDVKSSLDDGSNQMPSSNQISPENFPGHGLDGNRNYLPGRNYLPEQEDSHFFFYFLSIVLILMAGYLIFHNKQKIIALIVEGRHERRRRSHGAGYKKLETK